MASHTANRPESTSDLSTLVTGRVDHDRIARPISAR